MKTTANLNPASPLKSLSKAFKKALRRGFALLPKRVQGALLRRMVRLDMVLDPRLSFEIAERQDDLESAFRLLHDSYVEKGYMDPSPSGIRITEYHALPTTTTLVAKWEGRVVATVSIIRRTKLGLPLESIFSLEKLAGDGKEIVEISSLAIARDFRSQANLLMFLCRYLTRYSMDYLGADYMVVACTPGNAPLYEHLFLFERLQEQAVDSYAFVNGVRAVGLYLDLHGAENRTLKTYGGAPIARNLHAFFFQARDPRGFRYPLRPFHRAFDPVMTPGMLDHFFNVRTRVFSRLSPEQLQCIRQSYAGSPGHLRVLPELQVTSIRGARTPRHRARFPGSAVNPASGEHTQLTVLNASSGGFQARSQYALCPGQKLVANLCVGQSAVSTVKVKVVWTRAEGITGFQIDQPDEVWDRFSSSLEAEIRRLACELPTGQETGDGLSRHRVALT